MESGVVCVVIPAHNAAQFVAEAVRSALAQTRPASQIVVVDDGSDDDLGAALEPFRADILLLRNETARGVSAARNRAVAASTAEWIAFLDADDEWHPQYLEHQLAAVAGRPEVALVYCDAEVFGGRSHPSRLQAQAPLRPRGDYPPRGRVFRDLLVGPCFAIPTTTVVRREAMLAVGGFDERFVGGEDRDLWLRLAARWEVEFVPAVLARYRVRTSNETSPGMARQRLVSHIAVLQGASAYAPGDYRAVWPQLRRRLSASCFELGRAYVRDGDVGEARRWLLRGARYVDCLLPKHLLYLAATFLPRGSIALLSQMKRALCRPSGGELG